MLTRPSGSSADTRGITSGKEEEVGVTSGSGTDVTGGTSGASSIILLQLGYFLAMLP